MNAFLFTRMLLMKKQVLSIGIWLLMPLAFTYVLSQWLTNMVEESQIPIAIVDEDESELSRAFIDELQQIDLFRITVMEKQKALYALEKNELDSVFVLKRDFQAQLQTNKRNDLIEAYATNRSYFYFVVKENITSLVQRKATQAKAAYEVKKILNQYGSTIHWSFDDIMAEGQQREDRYQLLTVDFSYYKESSSPTGRELFLNPWGIWAFFVLISSFYLLDWVIKEANHPVVVRWLQSKSTYQTYFFSTVGIFILCMWLIDCSTYVLLATSFHWADVGTIMTFRFSCAILALFIAVHMKTTFQFYCITPVIALLLAFVGGAFIPMGPIFEKWPVLTELSPVYALLQWEVSGAWLIISGLLLLVIYLKGVSRYA